MRLLIRTLPGVSVRLVGRLAFDRHPPACPTAEPGGSGQTNIRHANPIDSTEPRFAQFGYHGGIDIHADHFTPAGVMLPTPIAAASMRASKSSPPGEPLRVLFLGFHQIIWSPASGHRRESIRHEREHAYDAL